MPGSQVFSKLAVVPFRTCYSLLFSLLNPPFRETLYMGCGCAHCVGLVRNSTGLQLAECPGTCSARPRIALWGLYLCWALLQGI